VAIPKSDMRVVGLEPDQEQYRLLVVEDNDANRELLVTLLIDVGFEVREAVNGQEAINVWQEWQPHLIWMDIRMPVLNGYEATQKINSAIRKQPSGIQTKIIALTASAFEEDKIKAIENGCNGFVRKPFREADIFNAMLKQLDVRFVYDGEEAHRKSPSTKPFSVVDLHSIMTTLPEELLAELADAANLCDADKVDQIIEDVRVKNAHLGEALASLSTNFAYDEISTLASKVKES
jgi:CheY-like chemotaxis protein